MSRPDFKFIEFVADASAACMNTEARKQIIKQVDQERCAQAVNQTTADDTSVVEDLTELLEKLKTGKVLALNISATLIKEDEPDELTTQSLLFSATNAFKLIGLLSSTMTLNHLVNEVDEEMDGIYRKTYEAIQEAPATKN